MAYGAIRILYRVFIKKKIQNAFLENTLDPKIGPATTFLGGIKLFGGMVESRIGMMLTAEWRKCVCDSISTFIAPQQSALKKMLVSLATFLPVHLSDEKWRSIYDRYVVLGAPNSLEIKESQMDVLSAILESYEGLSFRVGQNSKYKYSVAAIELRKGKLWLEGDWLVSNQLGSTAIAFTGFGVHIIESTEIQYVESLSDVLEGAMNSPLYKSGLPVKVEVVYHAEEVTT